MPDATATAHPPGIAATISGGVVLSPYVTFNGNCRQAMQFYQSCLGGNLEMLAVKDSPVAYHWPTEQQTLIMHAALTLPHFVLQGSDMVSPEGRIEGNAVALLLHCTSENQIKQLFARLQEGGNEVRPLERFFGGMVGSLTDKFGNDWVLKL